MTFGEHHQGGPGVAHSGIVAAALDEAAGLLGTWHRFPTVTARLALRFRQPAPINRPLSLVAHIVGSRGRRIDVEAELREDDSLLASGEVAFLHVPLEHFLATPEGQAAAEAWRRRLDIMKELVVFHHKLALSRPATQPRPGVCCFNTSSSSIASSAAPSSVTA